jgi:hypothetical protein
MKPRVIAESQRILTFPIKAAGVIGSDLDIAGKQGAVALCHRAEGGRRCTS